jgi:hypothetical protein
VDWIYLIQDGGPAAGSCEHDDNESLDSIKDGEFLD